MKVPTAWEYRHVFEVLTFVAFGGLWYGVWQMNGIVLVSAFVLFIINSALLIHLPD